MAVLAPPVRVALARTARTTPESDARSPLAYEVKLDGWRLVLFTADGRAQSRTGKDLSSRFPEITRAGKQLGDVVLDGELVALGPNGTLDFVALQTAPAARREAGVTVYFVAFDLLATNDEDLRLRPWRERRRHLEQLFAGVPPPLQLVPMTTDRQQALKWLDPAFAHTGVEGLVAKKMDAPYRAGRSDAWVKVRQKVVTDALVLGVTGTISHPDALVLGQPGPGGVLRAVGLSLPLSRSLRAALAGHLRPVGGRDVLPGVVGGLPGQPGIDYQPVQPAAVVEVEADPLREFDRFRHRPTAVRFRADLTESG